jgi:hypothetical protein
MVERGEKRETWALRVRGWKASGLSAREYGEREGFDGKRLTWWHNYGKKAAQKKTEDVASSMVPLRAVLSIPPVVEVPIEIANGVVRVRAGFNENTLREIVRALAK